MTISNPADQPPLRVLRLAERDHLGRYERRFRRHVGIGGALACLVILIVVLNLLVNGPDNLWGRAAVATGFLIILLWAYSWFNRTRGGLYLFADGFVDAAGRRVVSIPFAGIHSIKAEKTQFAVGSLPAGSNLAYEIAFTFTTGGQAVWRLNTTYADLPLLTTLISRRSGVPLTGYRDPYF
ncbi:hypothetical protein HPO96_33640 [Kribbella sandramycini]|uniref:Uncharacterized protein n=1 Tax=Kribbella sandramycini TaxID=60450 RepID=A0A7Y4L6D6_9ACTN|nr:hypothetical protein [Kribbella sandramycini]MBB6570339.1 hypothetical protein [Kribbella sandramycini]NOL45203.1 hypothetical protein [Kribbella sandramycini]